MKLVVLALLVGAGIVFAQNPPAKRTFEVASVRPVDPNNAILVGMSADPSVVRYRNLTLRDAIRGAYQVRDFQIVGPDWMSTVRFEVDAKMPAGATSDQIPEMFQALLEERFRLTFRREPKEMPVYALTVANGGPKLTQPAARPANEQMAMGTDGKPRSMVSFGGSASSVTVFAPNSSFLTLVGVTSRFTARPLVDETRIDGLYDFQLTFLPEVTTGFGAGPPPAENGAGEPAPGLADAVKKYGLRIEPRRSTIDLFVISHVERTPTEN